MKVTTLNIDDIIRAEKRKLHQTGDDPSKYQILWGDEEFKILALFTHSTHSRQPYMGMYHSNDGSITGYYVQEL